MTSFLVEHGLELALGITIVLAVGALATACARGPIQRHALARLSLVAAWAAALLLALPLPRPARFDLGRPVLMRHVVGESVSPPAPSHRGVDPPLLAPAGWLPPVTQVAETTTGRADAISVQLTEPQAPPVDLGPWLARAFYVGASCFLLQLLAGMAVLRRTLRRARPGPTHVVDLINRWGLQVHTRARVLVSEHTARPFCCGVVRGTIVLPVDLVSPERSVGLEAVARHELAHLAQGHPTARLVAALSAPLLYWNPLYWWLARELRRSAEILADDAAAASLDKRRYVFELLSLAERSSPSPASPGIGVLGPRRDFLHRMETLLMRNDRLPTSTSRRHLVGRSVGAALLLSTVSVAWGHTPQESAFDPQSVTLVPPPKQHSHSLPVLDSTGPAEINIQEFVLPTAAPPAGTGQTSAAAATAQEWLNQVVMELTPDRPRLSVASRSLSCVLLVDDASALGRFLYAAGDAQLQLGGLTLSPGGDGERTARFTLAQTALPELALVARAVDGAMVLSCKTISVRRAVRSNGVDDLTSTPHIDGSRRDVKLESDPRLDDQTASTSPIRGVVTKVAKGNGGVQLTINRGGDVGVHGGTTFEVYSGSQYKGCAEVVAVQEHSCTAMVTLAVGRGRMGAGDSVTTKL